MFKWKTEVLMLLINPSGDLALQIEKRRQRTRSAVFLYLEGTTSTLLPLLFIQLLFFCIWNLFTVNFSQVPTL